MPDAKPSLDTPAGRLACLRRRSPFPIGVGDVIRVTRATIFPGVQVGERFLVVRAWKGPKPWAFWVEAVSPARGKERFNFPAPYVELEPGEEGEHPVTAYKLES